MGILNGKVAVITGAASGIGLGTAEKYIEEGASVILADIDDDNGKKAAERLGDKARFVHTDVTDEAQIAAAIEAAVESFGKLDILYNNAGAQGDPSGLRDVGSEGFDRTMALLVRSVVLGHKQAVLQFEKQGSGGSIISTASVAGLQGGWSALGYTTAKHAVLGVVRQAVAELAGTGIRTNVICPGIIMTPIMARSFGLPLDQAEAFEEVLAGKLADAQPIGRVGRPSDIAGAAAFLGSDLSAFVNGAVIPVDGGATAVTAGDFAATATAAAEDFASR